LPHGEWPPVATAPGQASVLDAPIDSLRARLPSARRRYADARGVRRFSEIPPRVPQIHQEHHDASWIGGCMALVKCQEILVVSAGHSPACRSASNSNHMAFRITNAQASPRLSSQMKYHMAFPQWLVSRWVS